ncbi:hypothetical protein D0C36_03100 [Mucilaginibacter conchicola]|uniref:Uncharacterized protein n=1 Tax=Mucilaginibacter conchicola TaxID=2303333 RepID=A0A372NWR4_9SPHI|nr:hypothetical protein D0C36_03100 [Mucilaginibacter conchicola]
MADAINKGIKVGIVISPINISSENSTPAIGLLNTAAIPADVPAASNTVFSYGLKLKNLPTFEPIAAPVQTIGASKPEAPPKPTVSELVMRCE